MTCRMSQVGRQVRGIPPVVRTCWHLSSTRSGIRFRPQHLFSSLCIPVTDEQWRSIEYKLCRPKERTHYQALGHTTKANLSKVQLFFDICWRLVFDSIIREWVNTVSSHLIIIHVQHDTYSVPTCSSSATERGWGWITFSSERSSFSKDSPRWTSTSAVRTTSRRAQRNILSGTCAQ